MVFAGAPRKVPDFLTILLAGLVTLVGLVALGGLVGFVTTALAEEIPAGMTAAAAAIAQIEAVFRNLFDTTSKLP